MRQIAGAVVAGVLLVVLDLVTAAGQPQPPPIDVLFTAAKVPLDVDRAAAVFTRAPARTIPMMPQTIIRPHGGGTVKEVRLRALHDGRTLFLELSWADATANTADRRQREFTDAVALQFPVQPGTLPNPFMGDARHPVNIWQWKASWQEDLARAADLRRSYPAMAVDYYYDVHLAKTERARQGFNAGAAAGNLRSATARTSAAEDLVAWGFGTLTTQPRQDVAAVGRWKAGRWTVIMVRSLRTPDEADAQFQPGETTHLNVAVWDGGNEDRNGQKNITLMWWPLRLTPLRR
ncbi:MAG: ethylbenzene dehydrogenase-related protein [Armatimonadota bacterium]|nr:ethylbenzene dehydrogenase-related protein [Armatimonadota bacterium]MDR7452580.1 ethylbenzene dehydrogenase-related protein [Armatimonadota bacterium]MDR7468205.1 ethylbenzene dehydrogenase-related protein [Armatimonadota bacterium]MDR7495065.1 ethylbenzene dehydrogenase-related protein [Armatimonadota bacterium]MDR7500115.1 ethylbenzene dehydrogenase-related protein [Armatimonadota bacterium]